MYILGVSAFYHDSAACLLKNGEIIAAAQEERFTRNKHDAGFPHHAILYCLKEARIKATEIDNVVFYEKPFVKFERLLETYLAFAPNGFTSFAKAMPIWIKNKLFQKNALIKELKSTLDEDVNWSKRLLFSEHHLSHAASAYYPSPFDSAAVLTLDGVGEWTTTSLAIGKGSDLKVVKEIRFTRGVPDNLLYSEIKVLHLVRDPRAVLHSRLQLEAFCGNTPRVCVQPLCQGYRATLRSITSYLSTLEGRPFWQFCALLGI